MGRTNATIAAIGLVACIALALMMQHVVKVQQREGVHPVVKQIEPVFSARLRKRPGFTVATADAEQIGLLRIQPKNPGSATSLARSMGLFIWRMQNDEFRLDALDVEILDPRDPEVRKRIRVMTRRKPQPKQAQPKQAQPKQAQPKQAQPKPAAKAPARPR